MCHLVFRRGRCNIPSFPKSRHWGRCKHVMWREVWSWAVNSEAGQIWAFSSFPLQQQADNEDSYRDRGDASISSRSSWGLRMKWWTDCCQCTSSTPPPISRNCQCIDGSDLHSKGGGKKWTLRGVKLAEQNRLPIYHLLSESMDQVDLHEPYCLPYLIMVQKYD